VEAIDRGLAGGEDHVAVLDHLVGWQAAGRAPEVHRAAARVEAQADCARGLDLDLEQVAGAGREDVVVVGRRRAARERQRGQPGARGGVLDLAVEPRPHRVELDEPLEERRLLGQPARRPLVEVVVAVDEPWRGEAAAAVDQAGVRLRRRPRAHRGDPVVLHDDVTGVELRSGDGRDRAAVDDDHGAILSAASRTASRIFS
jgi:hypothetical protein